MKQIKGVCICFFKASKTRWKNRKNEFQYYRCYHEMAVNGFDSALDRVGPQFCGKEHVQPVVPTCRSTLNQTQMMDDSSGTWMRNAPWMGGTHRTVDGRIPRPKWCGEYMWTSYPWFTGFEPFQRQDFVYRVPIPSVTLRHRWRLQNFSSRRGSKKWLLPNAR